MLPGKIMSLVKPIQSWLELPWKEWNAAPFLTHDTMQNADTV
jgi:hypothetical protein